MPPDPNRFQPYRESLTATLARTGGIAVVVAAIATISRLGRPPASAGEWYGALAFAVAVGWVSFGGHWVELAYLNAIRPKLAYWSNAALVAVRVLIWLVCGTILVLAAAATHRLLTAGTLPTNRMAAKALLYGGPLFVAVELVPHTFLLLAKRPSFWNLRG